ncbi:MAG: hypothetical protein ACRDJM_01660 [Actinomycetota bacterium]
MGTVTRRRIVASLALCAFTIVPSTGRASTVTYGPPYQIASQGGDEFNIIEADPATGEMTVLRVYPFGINNGLGCSGEGGFANFQVVHAAATPVKVVTVTYDGSLIDPYSWINVGVRQGGGFITSVAVRGPIAGTGDVALTMPPGVVGPVSIWFGIQVSSACPNVDGGHAVFTSVGVTGA